MLDGLKAINWSLLQQAHGGAEHIPAAIKGLISPDEATREKAYWQIDNHVVLQSDVYEAAFYVTPFLIEILTSPVSVGREHVYDLLDEIANGHAGAESFVSVDEVKTPLAIACRSLILEYHTVYLDEIMDKQSSFRVNALEFVCTLSEKLEEVQSVFSELVVYENDQEVKLLMLEFLSSQDSELNDPDYKSR